MGGGTPRTGASVNPPFQGLDRTKNRMVTTPNPYLEVMNYFDFEGQGGNQRAAGEVPGVIFQDFSFYP